MSIICLLFRICQVVLANFGAAESREIGAGAESFADVFGESPDIGAGATMDFDFKLGVFII